MFDLKVSSADPSAIRPGVEAILRRYKVEYDLRSAGQKELIYETKLPFLTRTDRIANAILRLQPGSDTEVGWEDKKKK